MLRSRFGSGWGSLPFATMASQRRSSQRRTASGLRSTPKRLRSTMRLRSRPPRRSSTRRAVAIRGQTLQRRRLEEAAVEVRDVIERRRRGGWLLRRLVEDAEEERKKHAREELALADGVEAVGEETALAVQPPLLLHEVEK